MPAPQIVSAKIACRMCNDLGKYSRADPEAGPEFDEIIYCECKAGEEAHEQDNFGSSSLPRPPSKPVLSDEITEAEMEAHIEQAIYEYFAKHAPGEVITELAETDRPQGAGRNGFLLLRLTCGVDFGIDTTRFDLW